MASNKWEQVDIDTREGLIKGVAPVIISASRSTDIPAFYSEWFINRMNEGYVKWINPFNRKPQYISFDNTRVIVFWTKDAEPIIPYLSKLDEKGVNYYFQFTLNDYENDGLEPRVRRLEERVDTFKMLSNKIGKDKVIWRFDPLIMTDSINVNTLLEKVFNVGNKIAEYTNKLVISFADISSYRKVQNNLKKYNIDYKEFTYETMEAVAKGLYEINKDWGLDIATCSEEIDLSRYDIKKNKCIDDDLMIKVFSHDKKLMDFLGYDGGHENASTVQLTLFDKHSNNNNPDLNKSKKLKDQGQRKSCGCIVSKDIGQYDTCNHQCIYCYANTSPRIANSNYKEYLKSDRNGESILR